MMLYFLNSRIPIEIETYGDYLWVQSKFHQDCCLIVFEPSSKVDRIFGSVGIVLDSYSRTLFCPGSPSRKMLVWVHQASSLNGESRPCVCRIFWHPSLIPCVLMIIQRQRIVTVFIICTVYIEYLPFFFVINVSCCIYWEFVVAGGFVELFLHCIVLNPFQ